MNNHLLKIRNARNKKGYTQDYMGEKLGISQKAYGKIENGLTRLTVKRLKKITEILDLDTKGLLD